MFLFWGSCSDLDLEQDDDMTIYDHVLIFSVWISQMLLVMLAYVGVISFVC